MTLRLVPIPAFKDNYIWMLARDREALLVDPGDAAPARQALATEGLTLAAILITHHHPDHTGGAAALAAEYGCPVFGPAREPITAVTRPLHDGDGVAVPALQIHFQVLDIPGHTAGHVAFYGHNIVFCGDTLFSVGCGRLFEGSAADMYRSLGRLAALADDTRLCCGHEYTEANLRFAQAVEPGNAAIPAYAEEVRRVRAQGMPSLPARLARERQVNPFLRCGQPEIAAAAMRRAGHRLRDPVEVFAVIRDWKDHFT